MSPVLSSKQRREKIRDNIATLTYNEIADLCGVHRRTICRDIAKWKQEGGFDQFLLEQFFKLYGTLKLKDPKHAFDRVCDLLRRRESELGLLASVDEIRLKWQENDTIQT